MSKYYKAEDVERLIENILNVMIGKEEPIETALCELPTIDIVRCEDCRHATYSVKNQRTHETFYACPYSCVNHEGKFFCSYGERIDNE